MQLIKRIALPVALLVFVAAVVIGSTGAFFSDTETSTGNTFTAGAIDLQIDNHSWYNGVEQEELSWGLSDLDGRLFFNFGDLKPGDWEEDTISLHINNNDAWMCSTLALTSNDDNSSTEPELNENGEVAEDSQNPWDGELASELNFIFWADDGDNVLESDEEVVLRGTPADLIDHGDVYENAAGETGRSQTFPIADSDFSIFGSGPIPGEETVYIGKAFCFGDLEETPVYQGETDGPVDHSPADNPGFSCSGELVNNISQTDSITGDLIFTAIQSRNNEAFSCNPRRADT